MSNRAELSRTLHQICANVYFQPTTNVNIKYPCIIYSLTNVNTNYADNIAYKNMREYTVQYISTNPDPIDSDTSEGIIEKILGSFSYIKHTNRFTSDNLYHDNFVLHY